MIIDSKFPEVITNNLILHPEEFCYYVYMPIKVGNVIRLPNSLSWTWPVLDRLRDEDWFNYNYWYLTVKHMWIDGYGNREGWHCDGFGSDDLNYIWSDCVPTQFCVQSFNLSEDHNESLVQMAQQAKPENFVSAKPNQLLRLTPDIVHRPTKTDKPILRTFIKISCSNQIYNLKGNARNPEIKGLYWEMVERKEYRNHPVGDKI